MWLGWCPVADPSPLTERQYQALLRAGVHDIGNAVSGALGCVEVLRDGVAAPGEFIEATREALLRVGAMVHALRRVSADRPQVERLEPQTLLEQVRLLVTHRANRQGVALALQAEGEPLAVDRAAATRRLFQLIDTALETRPGRIDVTVSGRAAGLSIRVSTDSSPPLVVTADLPREKL